jgi:hypothetical protein
MSGITIRELASEKTDLSEKELNELPHPCKMTEV